MEVSIREMKNRLSKYLKLVRAGKDVVITDRGRPVARLIVVQPSPKEAEADYIRRIAGGTVPAGNIVSLGTGFMF